MARPTLIIPYDPDFLGDGFYVPMPTLGPAARARALDDGRVFDYTHYSLVMDRERRTAMFAANNIDAARKVQVGGGLSWQMDERVGDGQLGADTYDGNQIDKGHLVRREDVVWGTVAEARAANKSTYFYANATPQHKNFNQDEWKTLEDWVLDHATDLSYRLCVITGTVLRDDDPTLMDLPPHLRFAARPAQLPAAFWKVIVLRDATAGGDDLAAVAFALKQSEAWNDLHGRRLLQLQTCQVTLAAIEEWTGLDFGSLKDVDELASDAIGVRALAEEDIAWPRISGRDDIRWSGPARRAQGLRALRTPSTGGVRSVGVAGSGCACHDGFDAKQAIAALSARLSDVVSYVAALEEGEGSSSVRAVAPESGGGPRSLVEDQGGDGMTASDNASPDCDSPVAEFVNAAPPALRDRVDAFARHVVEEGRIARGEQAPPTARATMRIIGGDAVPPGGFPNCVCVGLPHWGCTGVVVAPQIVLTAAHCGATIDRIMAGGNSVVSPDPMARTVAVRRAVVHPGYREHPYSENDITVLILDTPANVIPAGLATRQQIADATMFDVVGFGYNDPVEPKGFGTKRHVRIELEAIMARAGEDLGDLPATLGFHPEYEFVAGRKSLRRDSCSGDSGGPIYIPVDGNFRLAGLTSRATRTASARCGDGGIYVEPLYFLDFINQVARDSGVQELT